MQDFKVLILKAGLLNPRPQQPQMPQQQESTEGNAFAANGARTAKRRKLDEGEAEPTRADEETELEVDHMILDYVVYQAIEASLANRKHAAAQAPSEQTAQAVTLVDSFLTVFRAKYPTYSADPELRFRLRLLKLITLFTQRFTRNETTPPAAALKDLRNTNQERAKAWIGSAERLPTSGHETENFDRELPIAPADSSRNARYVLNTVRGTSASATNVNNHGRPFYGTSGCVSLLGLLPSFMSVSAAIASFFDGNNITDVWMHQATEWMLQAVLEQYLVFGQQGLDAIDEAFAWGYKPWQDSLGVEEEGHVDDEVNLMFSDDTEAKEVEGWSAVRVQYLEELFPDEAELPNAEGGRLQRHLESVAARFPIVDFEKKIVDFLHALSVTIAKPVLVQLEEGQLDGMSEEETAAFIKSCGLKAERFYADPAGFKRPR